MKHTHIWKNISALLVLLSMAVYAFAQCQVTRKREKRELEKNQHKKEGGTKCLLILKSILKCEGKFLKDTKQSLQRCLKDRSDISSIAHVFQSQFGKTSKTLLRSNCSPWFNGTDTPTSPRGPGCVQKVFPGTLFHIHN